MQSSNNIRKVRIKSLHSQGYQTKDVCQFMGITLTEYDQIMYSTQIVESYQTKEVI